MEAREINYARFFFFFLYTLRVFIIRRKGSWLMCIGSNITGVPVNGIIQTAATATTTTLCRKRADLPAAGFAKFGPDAETRTGTWAFEGDRQWSRAYFVL